MPMPLAFSKLLLFMPLFFCSFLALAEEDLMPHQPSKTLAYLVSDNRIPFWEIMSRGITQQADQLGYDVKVFSANNQAKAELKNTLQAIQKRVAGIVVSPTNSSACVTILELAQQAKIPVVIADIGTESGEYVSYISSDNRQGA